jgi:glycosyltransferase involved in cell wall biosynthesis
LAVASRAYHDAMSGSVPLAFDLIVPVYNEEASIDEFMARIDRLGFRESVIFVDNASTDATVERIEHHAGVHLIRHATNAGYGASIKDGIAQSQSSAVVIVDGDLEYPPEAIPDLLAALEEHPVVYVSRFLGSGLTSMPLLRRWGNGLISRMFNVLFQQKTTDLYTGMKGLRREVVQSLALQRDGFEHVAELGVQLARRGYRIHEIPVTYSPRTRGVSKMRHVPETMKFLWIIWTGWLRIRVRRP